MATFVLNLSDYPTEQFLIEQFLKSVSYQLTMNLQHQNPKVLQMTFRHQRQLELKATHQSMDM